MESFFKENPEAMPSRYVCSFGFGTHNSVSGVYYAEEGQGPIESKGRLSQVQKLSRSERYYVLHYVVLITAQFCSYEA